MVRWTLAALVMTAGLAPMGALAAEPPPKKMTMPGSAAPKAGATPAKKKGPSFYQMVRTIEASHPLMRAARAGLESLRAKLHQADWAYFPSFTLNAAATPVATVTGNALQSHTDESKWGYLFTAQVQMVQPIYTFGKILALRRAARQGVRVGRAAIDTARWELRYRLAQAWYGTLLADEMRGILDDGNKWLDKASKRMERLRDEDSDDYDQNEHLRLQSRIADFFAIEADNALLENQTQHGLRLLVGKTDPKTKVAIGERYLEVLDIPIKPAEHYVALARKHDPGMRIRRARAKAQDYLHDNRIAQALPDLVIVGSANMATSDVIERQPSAFAVNGAHALGVGAVVALRWQLDVPQRYLRAKEAGHVAEASALDVETNWQMTELRVRALWQRLKNQRKLVAIFGASRKAAQGWLMANWDLYEDGFGDFNDVMDSLVQFYGKKVAHLKIIHDHNILVYELSRAIGHDLVKEAMADKAAKKAKQAASNAKPGKGD